MDSAPRPPSDSVASTQHCTLNFDAGVCDGGVAVSVGDRLVAAELAAQARPVLQAGAEVDVVPLDRVAVRVPDGHRDRRRRLAVSGQASVGKASAKA